MIFCQTVESFVKNQIITVHITFNIINLIASSTPANRYTIILRATSESMEVSLKGECVNYAYLTATYSRRL